MYKIIAKTDRLSLKGKFLGEQWGKKLENS